MRKKKVKFTSVDDMLKYSKKKKKSKESTEKCINQKRIQSKVAEYKN